MAKKSAQLLSSATKQTITHEQFIEILDATPRLVPQPTYEARFDRAVAEIKRVCAGKRVGYAWSGGKDSIALELVMNAAGIHDCCFGMTNLEYQQFLQWVTDNMPPGLEVFNNDWDVAWLKKHPEMLFPATGDIAGRWFRGTQWTAQKKFMDKHKLDLVIVGRRLADGNKVGGPEGIYTNRYGTTRYSPLRNWTHADVFAALIYSGRINNLPPIYGWPRGYRVGTHAWAARQWTGGVDRGFAEVYEIEPARVIEAAEAGLESAQSWLDRNG